MRRRALGNSRAARQQRDSATVTLSRIASFSVTVPTTASNSGIEINHWNQLRLSTYFSNYSPMYDQMKIDKIRVKVVGSQGGTAQTSNLSPNVILAFDRNGLTQGQLFNTPSVSTYSSAQLKAWSTGNSFAMYQTIYPSTIMEKGQYIPTDSLLDPTVVANQVASNPAYSLSSPQLPFKPITLLAVDLGITPTAANTFTFTIEFEYTVTFRGMRKPSVNNA